MFWSGNFVTVKELKSILKEENVTLTQVLEADDILMECKADSVELIQYLTRPDVLSELITFITTEPPQDLDLQTQYRYSCIACEVLSSHIATLSDRLSADMGQMNRLCDFVSSEAPLNPLLASFFSKTIEMLLQRSSKQDWCLYHIVCLRVIEHLRSRREFLPNLLRHLSTSAIVDTLKFILKADDIVYKPIIEWLEDHEFLESLIKVICGTYGCEPEPKPIVANNINLQRLNAHQPANSDETAPATNGDLHEEPTESEPELSAEEVEKRRRLSGTASDNAALLLCDIIYEFIDIQKSSQERPGKVSWWAVRSAGEAATCLLSAVFSSPAVHRPKALVNGGRVLRALLSAQHHLGTSSPVTGVELALAPHLPLLHQALLTAQPHAGVGVARVEMAAVSAALAAAHHPAVPVMLCTLGTLPVLFDLMLQYPDCSVLHGYVRDALVNAVANQNPHKSLYTAHLFMECDLLTKIMDTFEKNGDKQGSSSRGGYMGHLASAAVALNDELSDLSVLAPDVSARWTSFRDLVLQHVLETQFTPLGGYHPPESYKYSEPTSEDAELECYEEEEEEVTGWDHLNNVSHDLTRGQVEQDRRMCRLLEIPEDDWTGPPNKKITPFTNEEPSMSWDKKPDDKKFEGLVFPDEDWAPDMCSEFPSGSASVPVQSEAPEVSTDNLFAREEDFAAAFSDDNARDVPDNDAWNCRPSDSVEENAGLVGGMSDLNLGKLDDASSETLANNLLTAMSGMSADVIANIVNANHAQPPAEPPVPRPATPPAAPAPSSTDNQHR